MQCSKGDSSVPDTPPMHETVSQRNMVFWDELCGTGLAKSIGVTDSSPESLKKFDDWYLAYYPYLFDHIPFESMRGRHVLEVGLGYGTVSQRLAEAGARYEGLDIARNPVAMVNHRLRQAGLPGVKHGRGRFSPHRFPTRPSTSSLRSVCLHHAGDMQKAIEECRRVLRTGGAFAFMVYYAYSYRRFCQSTFETLVTCLGSCAAIAGWSARAPRTSGRPMMRTTPVTRRLMLIGSRCAPSGICAGASAAFPLARKTSTMEHPSDEARREASC